MRFQLTPYAIALLVCAGATSVVALAVWHRRTARGAMPLFWFTLAAVQWQLTGAGEAAAVGVPAKILWSKINYVGVLSSPVFLFIFALTYAHQDRWLTRRNMALLWVIPAISFALAVTNEWHHLIWTDFTPSTDPAAQNVLIYSHGPWFWIIVAYVYVLLSSATVVLVLAALRYRRLYRRQAASLLLAMPFPWIGNVLYVFDLGPFPGQDLTPVGFMLVGALLTVSLFELRLLDLVPIARDAVIETMNEGVLVLDAGDRILDANPAACRMLGSDTLSVGQDVDTALAAYPALADLCRTTTGMRSDVLLDGSPPRHVDVQTSHLRDRRGAISGRVIVMRDITGRKEMEAELHQQERLAAVGQLAAGIAHDFRNIMATILLYAEMDLKRPDLPSRVKDHIRVIIEESNRGTDLVQQILDFSSRAMIAPQALDLGAFVGEMLDVLRRTIPEHVRISLELKPVEEGSAFTVWADAARLQQALMNLALNARDAMPEGGYLRFALSHLELGAGETPPVAEMKDGRWVCLAVSDTGTGMTEKVQEHLFEPFFTTKDVGQGTGLGLAQVHGIVRQHEGAIDVESAPGQGTTFRIYLPAYEEGQAEPSDSATPQGESETILLVEDDEALRRAAQSVLESLGYRVMTAANGREALALSAAPRWSAREPAIDLVITDMVMPEMGGKALMQRLTQSHPNLKALGVTGYGMEGMKEELWEAGFVEVIRKPLDVEELARAIRRALA